MNRAERRNQFRPKSTTHKAGLTFLTVAGVVSGAVGLSSPAHAAVYSPANCAELANDLTELTTNGGTLTANFSDTCNFAEGYVFQLPTTIIGPTDGSLNLRFTGSSWSGFFGNSDLSVSNMNFTKSADSSVYSFIVSGGNQSLTVSNSTFSDSSLGAAIYAEGNLAVTDSSFTNLVSDSSGAAIFALSTTSISNTSFNSNVSPVFGGAIYIQGATTIINSTFESNSASGFGGAPGLGGAIFSEGGVFLVIESTTFESNDALEGGAIYGYGNGSYLVINNSTFVGNSAPTSGAIWLSEGSTISNSTFWNNISSVTTSGTLDGGGNAYYFGNILANDDASRVIGNASGGSDLGANLYTDASFDDTTTGVGSSALVSPAELELSALALNQTLPTNTGSTETVAIGVDSIAYDFYTADSPGINPTADSTISLLLASADQRGAFRPFGAGYDVGAFEVGASQIEETEKENLADTGLPTDAGYLGLVGLGAAAILGGSAGLARKRKKAQPFV